MYVKGGLKRMCTILKIPGLNGDSNPDLCDAGVSALLVELSSQLGAGHYVTRSYYIDLYL